LEPTADEKIVELCRRGDERAFDLLTETYGGRLYAFVRGATGNHAAADEVLQDTLIKAFDGIAKFRNGGSFRSWLFRIAYNTSMDYIRSETSRAERERFFGNRRAEAEAERADVERTAILREDSELIKAALLSLPENQRTEMCLFAMEGFTIGEIASITGCAAGTAASHLHRARRALRDRLAGLPDEMKDDR
jgi:RNA polymerase sigma-70 factor, ECF subfamily